MKCKQCEKDMDAFYADYCLSLISQGKVVGGGYKCKYCHTYTVWTAPKENNI